MLNCTGCGKRLDPDFISKDTELTGKCHECLDMAKAIESLEKIWSVTSNVSHFVRTADKNGFGLTNIRKFLRTVGVNMSDTTINGYRSGNMRP